MEELDYELYVKYSIGQWGKLSTIVYEKWDKKEQCSKISTEFLLNENGEKLLMINISVANLGMVKQEAEMNLAIAKTNYDKIEGCNCQFHKEDKDEETTKNE